jgi:hypothetical protein
VLLSRLLMIRRKNQITKKAALGRGKPITMQNAVINSGYQVPPY